MALDLREYASALAWVSAAVMIWIVALLQGSNPLGFISLFAGGIGIATFVQTRRRLLDSARSTERIEGKVEELQSLVADLESENARLRAEADFDRRLRSGEED